MKMIKFLSLLFTVHTAQSSNILVVCPFFGKSHSAFIHPIVTGLAEKGHNVTMITTNLIKSPSPNLRQVQPNGEIMAVNVDSSFFKLDSIPTYASIPYIFQMSFKLSRIYLESASVQDFLEEDNHFDLVLVEAFFHESYYGFAHKYKAPLVVLGTFTYLHMIGDSMGNPSVASYLSYEFAREAGDLSLMQRTNKYFLYIYLTIVYRLFFLPRHQTLMRKHFGEDVPDIKDMERNISLALFNTHFSVDEVRPLIPGIVELGGVHLKAPNKLPKDLQSFVGDAKDGFIYCSFGSALRSASMPEEQMNTLRKVFGQLKQRILWKWEDDSVPDMPKNVMVSKWFPQSDLLAHPNIRLFITQGGMLSLQEAVNRGVPILGVSVLGDQPLNMAKLARTGMAIRLPFGELDEANLKEALSKLLDDPEYSRAAKRVSARFNDRQNTALETAVFWVEYIIRHGGAGFMKSQLAETSWLKYNAVDVYGVLLVMFVLVIYVVYRLLRLVCSKCLKRRGVKSNKKVE